MSKIFFSFLLFLFLFFSLSFSDVVMAQSAKTKLGIYAVDDTDLDSTKQILASCPPLYKIQFEKAQNRYDLAVTMKTYKETCGGVVILRIYVPGGKMYQASGDGASDATDYWKNRILPQIQELQHMKDPGGKEEDFFRYVDYVSGANENDVTPEIHDPGAMDWYAAFWTQLAKQMNGTARPLIGDMQGGDITRDDAVQIGAALANAMPEIVLAGGAWSHHAYGYNPYNPNIASQEVGGSLLYRVIYQSILDHEISADQVAPLYLTEIGTVLTITPKSNPSEYMDWVRWFDQEMVKDAYVAGGTIYQIGSPDKIHWEARDIHTIAPQLASYFQSHTGIIPAVAPLGSGTQTSVSSPSKNTCPGPGSGWVSSIFGGWWQRLVEGEVPEEIVTVTDASLPPRGISLDCVDDNTRGSLASHSYNIKSAQMGADPISESPETWWNSIGNSLSSIFSSGNDGAASYVSASLPPGSEKLGAFSYVSYAEKKEKGDEHVLGWFDWLFPDPEAKSTLGLCEEKKQSLPPGICCDDSGQLIDCENTTYTPGDPPGSITNPAGNPGGVETVDGYIGSCEYFDEEDPDMTKRSLAQASPCSYQKLLSYFNGNMAKAKDASMICKKESGGNQLALNDRCLAEKYPDPAKRSVDYSVGLFQINALVHCPAAKALYTWDPPSCTFGNPVALATCVDDLKTVEGNIKQMLRISSNGSSWSPWSASTSCGLYGKTIGGDDRTGDASTAPTVNGWNASTLVDRIQAQCKTHGTGVVQTENASCLDGLSALYTPGADQRGVNTMEASARSYDYLQCVGFVQGSVVITTGNILTRGGNAKDFAWNVPFGYRYIPFTEEQKTAMMQRRASLKPGDLLIWGYGTYGHIANVSAVVDPLQFVYTIAEANWGANGFVHKRNIDIFHEIGIGLIGYLTKI